MSKQLMMYANVAPLNKVAHKDLYLKTGEDFSFAKELNSLPLTAVEFPMAASEYAIVFTGTGDSVMPAVIMGVEKDTNLYLNEKEGWNAKYVPAFARRYPFVFSSDEKNERLTLCIDQEFSGFNTEGRGERLFDSEGEQTQYLRKILAFMEDYQSHFKRTQLFCKKLVELDLLLPMSAKIDLPAVQAKSITGFMGIDRNKLRDLPADVLAELVQNDWLELIYVHLHSIRHFGNTLERVMSKQGAPEQAESETAAEELH